MNKIEALEKYILENEGVSMLELEDKARTVGVDVTWPSRPPCPVLLTPDKKRLLWTGSKEFIDLVGAVLGRGNVGWVSCEKSVYQAEIGATGRNKMKWEWLPVLLGPKGFEPNRPLRIRRMSDEERMDSDDPMHRLVDYVLIYEQA